MVDLIIDLILKIWEFRRIILIIVAVTWIAFVLDKHLTVWEHLRDFFKGGKKE